jgi:uncharacterized protein YfaS (alpha-2-macroglobulin family)
MLGKRKVQAFGALAALAVAGVWLVAANTPSQPERRAQLTKLFNDGNFKDAYDGIRKLALDPKDDPKQVSNDLEMGVNALARLGRVDEIDEFREGVIAAHKNNWRLLVTAAKNYGDFNQHYGFIIADKFYRGGHRGGGRYVSSARRDRIRALQLFDQAVRLTEKETDKAAGPEVAQFYFHYARVLMNGAGGYEPWRLQYLSDLSQLPDYDEGHYYPRGSVQGAPVDEKGNPVLHHLPKGYDKAATDGERWRWLLVQGVEYDPSQRNSADMTFANFLREQFGVQTMAYYNRFLRHDDGSKNTSGTFALHTLGENETIARLATGIKRFTVPAEFNWIEVYRRVAARGNSTWGEQARDTLAQIFEDRRQYVKAASAWKGAIADYGPGTGPGRENWRQNRLYQIVGNWGRFEPLSDQPAGKEATVDFRFRNGNKVTFEAHAIKVGKLLADVKAYLKSSPPHVDWQQTNIADVGFRLVQRNEQQYLGEKAASWDVKLNPRPKHVDDRITVTTPLKKPGAYLLTAQMAGGNLSRIILWVSDTAILRKQLEGKIYHFVGDAVNGRPIDKANMEFFGWRTVQVAPNQNQFRVETIDFKDVTDKDGQLFLGPDKLNTHYNWVIVARKGQDGAEGGDRFAYLGFTGAWFGGRFDPEYNQTRTFAITDRPVYRPDQTVHFKAWVAHAKYDMGDESSFANQEFLVRITNPKGEKVLEKSYTTDKYGGLMGDLFLSRGAMLGMYHYQLIRGIQHYGGGSFRVEEYKKPEFEVKIEAPKEPVRLGEKITATIQAKYYFGAPVTSAKVKYKVLRNSYSSTWYPRGRWDWLYGRGYWWFSPEYAWFPGWNDWGVRRPTPWWWWRGVREMPEVVLDNEVPVGPDGTVQVVIDTGPAKELHGNQDHQYSITAEVTDESRRTIVGTGQVLVSRKPFQVFTWVNRGFFRSGDTIQASFKAQTLDQKPVQGKGELSLFRINYNKKNEPVEKAVQTWKLDTDEQGQARLQVKAAEPGQYRLSYKVTDAKEHTIEGAYLFVVRGEGFDGHQFRFNDIEIITDKREYNPGDKIRVMINTNQDKGTVLFFVRPSGVYQAPKVIRLDGKSTVQEVTVVQRDMPNFFIEAQTIFGGRVHTETREIVVPPEKRVLNVEITPSQTEYRPGQQATVKVRLTDLKGKPFVGSTVMTVYDRAVEYISGGSNVPEIKEFFWKWRRQHNTQTESNLGHFLMNLLRQGETGMSNLGIFGEAVVEELSKKKGQDGQGENRLREQGGAPANAPPGAAPGAGLGRRGDAGDAPDRAERQANGAEADKGKDAGPGQQGPGQQVAVRRNFADTAYWTGSLTTDKDGLAEVTFPMPENLTGWKIRVWAMGGGTRVGQAETEVFTKKDLLVRLQAPRFFVEKDEVVLSANVHNYLKADKQVAVTLELGGNTLSSIDPLSRQVTIKSGGEKRVDWRVKVLREGDAIVRMKAVTDEDADAMEMRFPCFVHGMLKMESFSGVIRPDKDSGKLVLNVPKERRINETRLEVRYSPTLAGAMVDALPYMVEYPYGCTEQTLNRFLPTVITQKILLDMKLDLAKIEEHRTNLNSQEIGNDKERIAKGWKRFDRNPVFNINEVKAMSEAGVRALAGMQCGDGGWGWFSGFGEHSWPHTTAVVVHGLQLAKRNGVVLPIGMLERGEAWLKIYQTQQVQMIRNAPSKTKPYKEHADNLDAMVYMVLVDANSPNDEMRDFLYRDRTEIAVYAKAMFGLALHKQNQADKLAMIMKNIQQYLVQDDENQTAFLRLPESEGWWHWYGSEVEANAYYLKLLSLTNAKDERASRLVKYLLNNRRHATYWNSTRDTAVCVEAMADYLRASGEDRPDMTVEIWLDGKRHKEVQINTENLFSFDNKLVLLGDAVEDGRHVLEVRRKGKGPVYFNAYLTNFTLEDFITKAGLEVRVNRKYYKLTRDDKIEKVQGGRGQALGQRVERYKRTLLENGAELKSGDLVEVELEIDSKNDYEYLIFEDMKPAGFEPLEVRSGYNANDLHAYMELRDEKVSFFSRTLARGKHSVRYRMRAEIPGRFSALPTRAYAMYAPELRGNSDEIKLRVQD